MATAADNRKSGIATSTVVLCTLSVLIFVFALSLFLQGGFRAAQASEYETKVLTPANRPYAGSSRAVLATFVPAAGTWAMPLRLL